VIRNTTQREAIQGAFEQAKRPLTAQELHELAKKTVPSLGLRTVYRHVKAMLDAGALISTDYPGQPVHYEVVDHRGSRPHLICRSCRKLYDLPIEEPEVELPEVSGFQIDGYEVILFGRCPECQD